MLDELREVGVSKIAGVVLDLSHQNTNGVPRIPAVK